MLLDTHITMPSQDPLAENKFSLQPRDLRAWLKNLPYVDSDAAVTQFYNGLRRSNRQAHTTKQRLAAIDIIRPTAHEFLKSQRKYLLSQPFPLSKKATEALKLQQNMLNELAVAYKIVIQETVNRDSHLANKKLVTCVHHAMYYQVEQYITLAQVYSEPPQSFWHDLCQLYGIAEHFELTGMQIKNDIDQISPKSSPKSIFVRACLLSLSNLHTYGHGEAEKISAYLSSASHLVKLSDSLPTDSEYPFFINLALRKPVRLIPDEDIPMSSKNRYIDATDLVNELKEAGHDQENDEKVPSKSVHTLSKSISDRLVKKIISKPLRSSKRAVPAKGRLHVVMGMRDAIEILQSGYIPPEKTQQEKEVIPSNSNRVSKFFNDDHRQDEDSYSSSKAWDWVGHGNVISEYSARDANQDKQNSDNKAELNPVVQTWDISNASKGGYCLTSGNTSDYQSQVGDLILIRLEQMERDEWRLGVIRWMQSLSDHGVKMGIETMHGSVQVMEVVSAHLTHEKPIDFTHILKITEQTDAGANKTIITPPNAASNGDHLVLADGASQQNIAFQHMLEQTISFARFSYSEMPSMPGGEEY